MTEKLTDEALNVLAGGSPPSCVGLDFDEALTAMARELLSLRRATPADDLLERAGYMVNNPSAWECFDQGASEIIRELVAALEQKGDA